MKPARRYAEESDYVDSLIAIEIIPIVEDNYYRTIVYDYLEVDDSGRLTKVVREFYHSDSFSDAIELLHGLMEDGGL